MRSIGIVSDSHNNSANLQIAVDYLVKELKIDTLLHLGDFYEDIEHITFPPGYNIEKYRVPGVHHFLYNNPAVKRQILTFENLRFLLSHTPRKFQSDTDADISIENSLRNKEIDVLLFGHTHQFLIDYNTEFGILMVNPGHLKEFDEQGTPPTFAHLILDETKLSINIYNLIFNTLLERRYII